ncbi:MAG: NAD(P)-dependent oxidoreductase [Burkholderiaceae bacterium]
MTRKTLVFIGLGLMGRPMVGRLIAAGHDVLVYDRDPGRLQEAVDSGARGAVDAAEVAAGADCIGLCVNGLAQVHQVVVAVGKRWRQGSLMVDFSSCGPSGTRALADRLAQAHGLRWVDAPMSGGPPAAQAARLTIMVGGAVDDVAQAQVFFDAFAGNWTHLGPVGSGQVAKIINQMLVLNTFCTVAEALRMAERSGLDASLIPQALAGGYADSAILQHHWEQMRERKFDPPTGYAWVNLKDLDMAIDLSRQLQTQVPMTSQAANVYRALIARGHGDLDTLAIYKLYDDPPV